nr:hypothetical protein [Tanacetum cinerariifolium]
MKGYDEDLSSLTKKAQQAQTTQTSPWRNTSDLEKKKLKVMVKLSIGKTATFAIVYNDGLTSKRDLKTEPLVSSEHIKEFETSVLGYDEEELNNLYFNDLFPFNDIHPDDLKSEKDNDDNGIDIIQSSWGAYAIAVEVFDPLPSLCIWEALGGNTRDLDSIWEETGQDCNFTRCGFKNARTVPSDDVTIPSNVVRTYQRRHQKLCDGVT